MFFYILKLDKEVVILRFSKANAKGFAAFLPQIIIKGETLLKSREQVSIFIRKIRSVGGYVTLITF